MRDNTLSSYRLRGAKECLDALRRSIRHLASKEYSASYQGAKPSKAQVKGSSDFRRIIREYLETTLIHKKYLDLPGEYRRTRGLDLADTGDKLDEHDYSHAYQFPDGKLFEALAPYLETEFGGKKLDETSRLRGAAHDAFPIMLADDNDDDFTSIAYALHFSSFSWGDQRKRREHYSIIRETYDLTEDIYMLANWGLALHDWETLERTGFEPANRPFILLRDDEQRVLSGLTDFHGLRDGKRTFSDFPTYDPSAKMTTAVLPLKASWRGKEIPDGWGWLGEVEETGPEGEKLCLVRFRQDPGGYRYFCDPATRRVFFSPE